jgi:hypothetical protein
MQTILELFPEGHPLITIIERCLQNSCFLRPDIQQVLQLLDEAKTMVRDKESSMNKLELIQALHAQPFKESGFSHVCEKSELEEQLRSKASELNRLEEANQLLRAQLEGKQAEASNLWEQVESLRKQGEERSSSMVSESERLVCGP